MSCTRYASMASLRVQLIAGKEPEWLTKHSRRAYIVAAVLSAPPWAWPKYKHWFLYLAEQRRQITAQTGVEHVLDHDVPLTHPNVCGLTVPWNLKLETYKRNATKSNNWNPHQGVLDL
jgi:hypothetical protein